MVDYCNPTAGEAQVMRDQAATFERKCADCDERCVPEECSEVASAHAAAVEECREVLEDVKTVLLKVKAARRLTLYNAASRALPTQWEDVWQEWLENDEPLYEIERVGKRIEPLLGG